MFLNEEGSDLTNRFKCNNFFMKRAYLSDMFLKLNDLNVQMQGTNAQLPHLAEKLTSLVRKLEMWQQQVKDGNVDSSENLKSFTETTSCRTQ